MRDEGDNAEKMKKSTWVFIHLVQWNMAHFGGHNHHKVPQIVVDGGTCQGHSAP